MQKHVISTVDRKTKSTKQTKSQQSSSAMEPVPGRIGLQASFMPPSIALFRENLKSKISYRHSTEIISDIIFEATVLGDISKRKKEKALREKMSKDLISKIIEGIVTNDEVKSSENIAAFSLLQTSESDSSKMDFNETMVPKIVSNSALHPTDLESCITRESFDGQDHKIMQLDGAYDFDNSNEEMEDLNNKRSSAKDVVTSSSNSRIVLLNLPEQKGFENSTNLIHQLDGNSELSAQDVFEVPYHLGTIDCEHELFHVLTLFRGFDIVWGKFLSHPLCDYKRKGQSKDICLLCLTRSYSARVNCLKSSGGKRLIKPMEIFSEMIEVEKYLKKDLHIESLFSHFFVSILENFEGNPKSLKQELPIITYTGNESTASSMKSVLEYCLRCKISSGKYSWLSKEKLDAKVMMFTFQNGCSFDVEHDIELFGIKYSYVCHLEMATDGVRSNF